MKNNILILSIALFVFGGAVISPSLAAFVEQQIEVINYREIQPSKIKKQKRVLRQRVKPLGWGVLLAALLLIGGIIWLLAWLTPMASVFWRVMAIIGGVALSLLIAGIALLIFSYAYPLQKDMRSDAEVRLKKLARELPFETTAVWCFPDDQFRLSLAANTEGVLVVDYRADKAWQLPKSKIKTITSAFVSADSAQLVYPATNTRVVLLAEKPFRGRAQPPYPGSLYALPMQVINFELTALPIEQLTVIYRGKVYGDSTQQITEQLRTFCNN